MSRNQSQKKRTVRVYPPTPPLPIASVPPPLPAPGADLTATEAHRVMLHCALDSVGVPVQQGHAAAVTRIAELDYATVHTVMFWLARASSRDG